MNFNLSFQSGRLGDGRHSPALLHGGCFDQFQTRQACCRQTRLPATFLSFDNNFSGNVTVLSRSPISLCHLRLECEELMRPR